MFGYNQPLFGKLKQLI